MFKCLPASDLTVTGIKGPVSNPKGVKKIENGDGGQASEGNKWGWGKRNRASLFTRQIDGVFVQTVLREQVVWLTPCQSDDVGDGTGEIVDGPVQVSGVF